MPHLEPAIDIYKTSQTYVDHWWTVREIARFALKSATASRRTEEEVEHAVGIGNPNYYLELTDPNLMVGTKLSANQQFWSPKLALASVDYTTVGYSYSVQNTTGRTKIERLLKRHAPVINENYFRLGSIAVMPEVQSSGVGKALFKSTLNLAKPTQPVIVDLWPQELGQWQVEKLEQLGFVQTGETKVKPFGPDTEPTLQVRMQAPSARIVLENIQ